MKGMGQYDYELRHGQGYTMHQTYLALAGKKSRQKLFLIQ